MMNMHPSWRTRHGILFFYLHGERLSSVIWFIGSRFTLMVLLANIKYNLWLKVTFNIMALTMIRPIFQWSNMIPFKQFLLWLLHMTWVSFNMIWKPQLYMVICRRKSSWNNQKVMLNLKQNNLFVVFTRTFMDFAKLLANGIWSLILSWQRTTLLQVMQTFVCIISMFALNLLLKFCGWWNYLFYWWIQTYGYVALFTSTFWDWPRI